MAVGAVFQLSTASCCNKHIDLTGWYMGDGPNKVYFASLASEVLFGNAVTDMPGTHFLAVLPL